MGETSKSLQQRMSEHKRVIMRMDLNNSLAALTGSTYISIDWDKAIVNKKEDQEAIHIKTTPYTCTKTWTRGCT